MTTPPFSSAPARISNIPGLPAVLRQRGMSLVAGNVNNFDGSSKTATANFVYDTTRSQHQNLTGKPITYLVLVYANYGQAGSTEVANPNPIQVQCSVELTSTVTTAQTVPRNPVYFSGLATLFLDKRTIGYSQPIPVYIPPGAYFYVRTGVAASSGTSLNWQRGICTFGGTALWGTNQGDGASSAANLVADSSGSIAINAQTAIYSPSAILGILADGTTVPSVAILGDSIAAGTDDAGYGYNYGGWPIRAFAAYPMVYVPIAGETAHQFAIRSNSYCRNELAALASTIICQYGRNDCTQFYATTGLSGLQADILTIAATFMSQGKKFVQSTVLPAPSSTDGYFTVANQSVQTPSGIETMRVGFNDWVRNTGPTGFVAQAKAQVAGYSGAGTAAFIDPCVGIECNSSGVLTLDAGLILPVQTGNTDNGTSSGSNTASTFNDTTKSWTVNAWKGYGIYIVSGTGSGQSRCIGYNTANQLGILNSWSVTPDNTSVYKIGLLVGLNGVHPLTQGHILAAASINPSLVVV